MGMYDYSMDPDELRIKNRIKQVNKKMNKKKAWEHHMFLLNQPLPSIEETVNIIMAIKNPVHRALFAVIYLTGSRVSEILARRDPVTNEIKEPCIPLRFIWVEDNDNHVIQHGENLETKWLIIQTRVLKLRTSYKQKFPQKKWKKAYINVLDPVHRPLLKIIDEHLGELVNQNPDSVMFPDYRRSYVHRLIKKHCNWNTHYLRHLRASHLVKYYGYSDTELRAALGWASTSMSARYTHSDEESLKKKMEVY